MKGEVEQLRSWAQGDPALAGAVELLASALGGRFAAAHWPWIVIDGDAVWLDAEAITADSMSGLSGGERRILTVVAGLAVGAPVDVRDVLTGIDPASARMVLSALARAAQIEL